MFEHYLAEVARPGQEVNPLFHFLGVVVGPIGGGEAELRLPFRDGFIQGAGVVAGGIVSTLMAEAMAHAVISTLEPGQGTSAIQIGTHYLRSVKTGDDLVARAKVVKRGSRVAFVEAEAATGEDRVAAAARGSFMINRIS